MPNPARGGEPRGGSDVVVLRPRATDRSIAERHLMALDGHASEEDLHRWARVTRDILRPSWNRVVRVAERLMAAGRLEGIEFCDVVLGPMSDDEISTIDLVGELVCARPS
jgi:hypothetical protein